MDKIPVVKGEWDEVVEYAFRATCPKCRHVFDNVDVSKYDGEAFTKTLVCFCCKTKIKIKTKAIYS